MCKDIWATWVEPNSVRLTERPLMNSGQYTLIRLCNKLAQRMSKTHDSAFCGQVRMDRDWLRPALMYDVAQ